MISGFNYKNLLKIGFLNKDIDKNINNFQKAYDALILSDGSILPVNKILAKMCP